MNKKGVGYSTIFYGTGYGNGFPDESRAIAKIEESGIIKIYVEVSDVGSGGESVMWQIASQALNINPLVFRNINTFQCGSKTATGQILDKSVGIKECISKLASIDNIEL